MLKEETTTRNDIDDGCTSIIALDCGFCSQCHACVQKHLLFYAYVEKLEEQQHQHHFAMPCEVALYILRLLHIDIDWCNESVALDNIKRADEEVAHITWLLVIMNKQQRTLTEFEARWSDHCCEDPAAIDRLSYFEQDHCALLRDEISHLQQLTSVAQRRYYVADERRGQFFFVSHRDKFAFRRLTGYVIQQQDSPLFTYLLYHSIQWRMKDVRERSKWKEMGVGPPEPLDKTSLPISHLTPMDLHRMQLYLQCKLVTPTNMVRLQSVVGIQGDGTRPTYACDDEYEWWCTGAPIPGTELEIVHRLPYGSDACNQACYIVRDRCWHGDDLNQGQAFKTRKQLMQWLVDQQYAVEGTYCELCLAWRRNNDDVVPHLYHCNKTCPNYK